MIIELIRDEKTPTAVRMELVYQFMTRLGALSEMSREEMLQYIDRASIEGMADAQS